MYRKSFMFCHFCLKFNYKGRVSLHHLLHCIEQRSKREIFFDFQLLQLLRILPSINFSSTDNIVEGFQNVSGRDEKCLEAKNKFRNFAPRTFCISYSNMTHTKKIVKKVIENGFDLIIFMSQ